MSNKVDTAIAWNFENIVLSAYRWLSAHHKEGDRIYLFGDSIRSPSIGLSFELMSRYCRVLEGAYQVRALAGMIHKVGLILPGNEEQIPFAYQLYADHHSEEYEDPADASGASNIVEYLKTTFLRKSPRSVINGDAVKTSNVETFNMAKRFKQTFSRKGDVRVHYLGVWDTVSSIGLARSKSLPLTDTCEHFCYMRHALALDERRVKFQPEYACGGESWIPNRAQQPNANASMEPPRDNAGLEGGNIAMVRDELKSRPRVKEVCGGGIKSNTELNNAAIPALWMGNEAVTAGLDLTPSRAEWDWDKLKEDRPTESLSFVWRILEAYPFRQLSYKDVGSTCRRFHLAKPRIIQPGQKIHASVAFVGDGYYPKAKFSKGIPNGWDDIIGKGFIMAFEWTDALGDLLELDLFDHSSIPDIMDQLSNGQSHTRAALLGRLIFMASTRTGFEAITGHSQFKMFFNHLHDKDADVKTTACAVLAVLASQDYHFTGDQLSTLFNLLHDKDASMKIITCDTLATAALSRKGDCFTGDQSRALFDLLGDEDASVKVAACDVLGALAVRGPLFTDDQFRILLNLLDNKSDDTDVKIAICGVFMRLALRQDHDRPFANDATSKIYCLFVGSDKALRNAGLRALGGFQCSSIPTEVSTTICGLVIKAINGTSRDDAWSAAMALSSCIHEPDFFRAITKHIDVYKLIDVLIWPGAGASFVRGLVGLMAHGGPQELVQKAIARNPLRVAFRLIRMLGGDNDFTARRAGLQGVLAFCQSGEMAWTMRGVDMVKLLSRLATDKSNMPEVQHDVLLALEALVKDDVIANEAMEYSHESDSCLPEQIKCQLESDPRFRSDIGEDIVQSGIGVSTI
ncbi:hypothetical protein BD779DRAFT_1676817 [Infundibulicybe gibba]|nr:hypothetical protein BD779DRAFT_1676817 [Infundibulicybe gibba]